MGLLSKLFGIEPPQDQQGAYEERLQKQADAINQPGQGPVQSPQGDGVRSSAPDAAPPQAPPDPYRDTSGRKIVPELEVTMVDPHPSVDRLQLELWATLHNKSQFEIEVTEIELLGHRERPGRYLKPNEQYELRLYRGETPKTDAYSDVIMRYRIVDNSDYFEQRCFMEYHPEDGLYMPKRISPDRPVRDI